MAAASDGLRPDSAFGRKPTRIGSIHGDRAQSSIGIDHHNSGRGGGNRRTKDIVDRAPVTDLAKNTVHTRVVADDDIVIDSGDTRPGHAAQDNVIACGYVALERLITDGCVGVSGGVGSERVTAYGGVGAAGGIVHERKVTSGSVGGTGVVKDQSIGSNGGVLCAGGVEQERCRPTAVLESPLLGPGSSANTSIETAGGIQKERLPTECCVSSAGGERVKRVAPFGRREIGVTRVRCRCWRGWGWNADVIDVFFAVECRSISDVGAGIIRNNSDVVTDLALIGITDKRTK